MARSPKKPSAACEGYRPRTFFLQLHIEDAPKSPPVQPDPLTHSIIGTAIKIHRHIGPGLLESVYERCLDAELADRVLSVLRQKILRIRYKALVFEDAYSIDLIVNHEVSLK